ncbi:uncharacterized protein LOC117314644 [Pecten maximus]|uniref:uncharacterized protein LOC117314644 n=1 Tax=Pecten maximus TaxID=6579 RepID=UPI0014582E9D|nr:uncharacterized protein LOC117314644 [Pecten maximus]XP_033724615.1 uncharacterized protein LOC117314644 [Pecten maximus]
MDSCSRLILYVCFLLVSSVNRLDALRYGPKTTVGGSDPNGLTTGTRQGFAFGGFGVDALCALCIRMNNYQCYLRYCSGGSGSFRNTGRGSGGLAQVVPWNPTCAMCVTDSCRRLWCASGVGRIGIPTGTVNGLGGGLGPGTGYTGYGAYSVANRYALSIPTYPKSGNYGKSY